MAIDFQALMDIARVNEEEVSDEDFNMNKWMNNCGTVGCMVGNWLTRRRDCALQLRVINFDGRTRLAPQLAEGCGDAYIAIASRFGFSALEAEFLFGNEFSLGFFFDEYITQGPYYDRAEQSRLQNIARLRKFIYYKLRKAEIFADYERARHQEGDWHVAQDAKERALEAVA